MNEDLRRRLTCKEGPLKGNEIHNVQSISEGSIHKTWHLHLKNGTELFAKTASANAWEMLNCEAKGLEALRKFTNPKFVEIPEVIAITQLCGEAILLLPWLDFLGHDQNALGTGLALIHKSSAAQGPGEFGWDKEGFIGAGPQPKGWEQNWGECFVKLRLLPQMKLAVNWGLQISEYDVLLNSLIQYLEDHKPEPCLVHGDLWSGNAAVQKNGLGVLIDPACWWADREVDIAMTKLFGGFSANFYKAYNETWALSPTSETRIEIYNLYHLLNHANLFGGSYISRCYSTLQRLNSEFCSI